MSKTETKPNETEVNETNQNDVKQLTPEQIEKQKKLEAKKKAEREAKERAEAQRAIKENPLYFEVPLPEDEALEWLTDGLQEKRQMLVNARTVRISDGRLMVGCLPEGEK